MDTPKQCPFCGWYEIYLLDDFTIGDEKCYMCQQCQAVAKEEMWNKRPIEDGLKSQIYELESIMAKVKGYL
jgi:hypothetical protein